MPNNYPIREKDNFDPEGSDYDYQTALKYGIRPDETGHWQSRVPQTGMLLKGRKHETWPLTVKGEEEAGYQIVKVGNRYVSVPKPEPIRANIPLPRREGLVSPGLKKAYRGVLTELSKPVEARPGEPFTEEQGLESLVTRILKQVTFDIPGSFLKRGGQALERPEALSSEDLLLLAGETTLWGMLGGGIGPASAGGRVPMKGFFSPLQKGIRQVIKEGTGTKESSRLFKRSTDMPLYESISRNPEYFKTTKGMTSEKVLMSPDEYINEVATGTGISREELLAHRTNLDYLSRQVTEGKKLNLPSIEYYEGGITQEGLHRALLAKKLGQKEIPVLRVFNKVDPSVAPIRKLLSGPVSKPGQALLNQLKKKGVSSEELGWTGVEEMLSGTQKPIALKDVMKQAIKEEIKVGEKKLVPWKKGEAYPNEMTIGEFTQYGKPAYRKPFTVSEDIPYEETLLILKQKPGTVRFKDIQHYAGTEDLMAWSRTEIRPGSKGEKVRMIQEAQESGWGITGRKKGFGVAKKPEILTSAEKGRLKALSERSRTLGLSREEAIELAELGARKAANKVPPPTPFEKDALKLMLKKELYEAASDPTVTHLGWTPGWMQVERWPSEVAEKGLLQIYDEIIPGFLEKQARRLGKGKKGLVEEVKVLDQSIVKETRKTYYERTGETLSLDEISKLPEKVKLTPRKVPALKLEDWIREAILKGQRISKIDQEPFRKFMRG